ncbi:MAG: cytochrome P450 [Myxococcales bacterium]|nr:cytochrome P450 [Myxococcales bacterium]MCB9717423.1 cytochrome P450 [Myxococcales bacterium]
MSRRLDTTPAPRSFRAAELSWPEELRIFRLLLANYVDTAFELHRRHGDVVRRRLPKRVVSFVRPSHLRHILRTNVRNYPKDTDYEFLRPILGDGLFVSDGAVWTQQRRLVAPELRANTVQRFLPTILDSLDSLFEQWHQGAGQPRDVSDDMMRLTLWVVGAAMFHRDFRAEAETIGHCLEICLEVATRRFFAMGLYPAWLPTPDNHRAREAERTLDRIVRDLITRGRGGGLDGHSVLSRLVAAADDETGARMTDRQLLDEVKSLILAGHETTSLALSWTFYLLAEHPEVEARLVDEVREVLGERPPTPEDVPRLEYTRMVLMEAMRLYPPVPGVPRGVREEDEIEGVRVAPGDTVIVFPCVTHRHPDYWERPDQFDPERFSAEQTERRDPYAYLPFLLGRRACVGEHFAMLEGVVALAMIVSRWQLRREDDRPIATRPISTLRMARPLRMRVRPRPR